MAQPIKLEHILNRIWFVICLAVLAYQFSHVPKFLKDTSYEARYKITSTATKMLDDMYLQKYGVTAEKYRWLHKSHGGIVLPRERLQKLSDQIKFTVWTQNIFFSLIKNILIFFGSCVSSLCLVRIFPVWIIHGNGLSFKHDLETFPMSTVSKFLKNIFYYQKREKK